MYLYRCRLLYSKAIMDFFSGNFFQIEKQAIVKVETKHGVDLAIYLNKTQNIDDKEFEEILKYQAVTAEETIDNVEISQEYLGENGFSKIKIDESANFEVDKKGENTKKHIKIEGKFISTATSEDLKRYRENEEKEEEAFKIFKEEIKGCNLEHEMKPVGVHYFLDGMKILFDFIADHRIDFRELVKKLAARYKRRIELHQIGVRDEARMLDGIFICGQQLCCRRFLHQLTPISIKMAEVQNAPLNTMKISGYCGRLLCCLAYESDQYEKAKMNLPPIGTNLTWNDGNFLLTEINVIKQYLKLKKKDSIEYILVKSENIEFDKDEQGNIIIKKADIYSL